MKVSSRARHWVREFTDAARAQDQSRRDAVSRSFTAADLPGIVAALDEQRTREELDLLYRFANLPDNPESTAWFRRQCPVPTDEESDADLLRLRDELREMWGTKDLRHPILGDWFGGPHSLTDPKKWVIYWQFGIIRPCFFQGELAWAYCRHHARMAICANPECVAKYFVANRRSQRYCCANDECTRYAGREAANRYWRKKQEQAKRSAKKGK